MKPKLKLKVRTRYLASIFSGVGITIRKDGLAAYPDLDFSAFAPVTVYNPVNETILLQNISGAFSKVTLATLNTTYTGDVTITAGGVTAIGVAKVTSAMLNADVFSTAHTWAGQQTFVAPILGAAAATSVAASGQISSTSSGGGGASAPFLSSSSGGPAYGFVIPGAAADQGIWDWRAAGTTFLGRAVNDANSAATNWLTVNRGAGIAISSVAIPALSTVGTLTGGATGTGFTVNLSASTISGTLPAANLPNPSATTLGGIQSLAGVASKWINTISPTGVPSATQPAFTDISGSVAAAQMPALTGDITTTAGTVATAIGANKVTNAMRAQMAAYTLKGNATGALANEADIDVTALTAKASPVSADIVLIQDSAAANAMKRTTVGALASVGFRGYLSGLTLSTAGASATFSIAGGVAADSTNVSMIALLSAYTKTTGAWALGTAAGSLDTGAIANLTWYHAYLIQRPDTGVVDVLISLSATAPTMPTSYTLFRRIGSMKTNGSAQWTAFSQIGDEFLWSVPVQDISVVTLAATAASYTLTVPTGVQVLANTSYNLFGGTGGTAALISSLDTTDTAPAINGIASIMAALNVYSGGSPQYTRTNTSAQIRIRASNATGVLSATTQGWIDARGKDK